MTSAAASRAFTPQPAAVLKDFHHIGKLAINALPFVRGSWRAFQHQRQLADVPEVRSGIDAFARRWGDASPLQERPVFILAAGWRSGSTLLQRLVMSSGDALVWGEPYHECGYIQRMADSLRAITDEAPADSVFHDAALPAATAAAAADFDGDDEGRAGTFDDRWVANLFPAARHLLAAHRAFFQELFAEPARASGYERWGMKAVRLSMEHARYLHWVYPDARLLFLIRDPYTAYRSYRMFRPWYRMWPSRPVVTARDFGEFWTELAGGFLREHGDVNGMVLHYESLSRDDGTVTGALAEFVDMPLRRRVLERKVIDRRWPLQPVPAGEIAELREAVEPLASELGYAPPRERPAPSSR